MEISNSFADSYSTPFLTFSDPGAIFNSISNFGPEGPKNSSGGIEGSQPAISNAIQARFQTFFLDSGNRAFCNSVLVETKFGPQRHSI